MTPSPALFPLLCAPAPVLALPAVVPSRLPLDTVVVSDALAFLRGLPDASVDCVVTSPPYFGLRDYGVEGQIGLEPTPAEFVVTMVTVFREVRRVLKASGTCWVNLGDSYNGSTQSGGASPRVGGGHKRLQELHETQGHVKMQVDNLAPKNLLGIPWRVAIALQDDGWILRSDIIWSKPNPMPESVTDRPTKAHEYVFLLTKAQRYFYDADAVREPCTPNTVSRLSSGPKKGIGTPGHKNTFVRNDSNTDDWTAADIERGANKRSVWTVATEPTPFAHFATFPRKLIEPMILAGCPAQVCAVCGAPYERIVERETNWQERRLAGAIGDNRKAANVTMQKTHGTGMSHDLGTKAINDLGFHPTCKCDGATRPGVVLDMFMGSGTVALVARHHNRHFVGCDLNPAYVALARERLRLPFEPHHVVKETKLDDLPLFAGMEPR